MNNIYVNSHVCVHIPHNNKAYSNVLLVIHVKNGWKDEWIDRCMDEWIDRWKNG